MGGRVGGLTSKYYKETKGIKVSGGQRVKKGTILTREGHRWHPGLNVLGTMHLVAGVDGEVYFSRKKGSKKVLTYIHIRPMELKPAVKQEKKTAVKKAVKKVSKKKAE